MKRIPNLRIHPPLQRRSFLRGVGASAVAGTLLPLGACGGSDDGDEVDDSFSFVVITDTHIRLPGNPDDGSYKNQLNIDNLKGVVARINTDYPDAVCVVVTGDLVGCLFSDDPADYKVGTPNPAETFKSIMDELTIPYYPVLGNHDYQKGYDPVLKEGIMTDDIAKIEAVWNKVLELDPYYADVIRGVRFIFLNSNRGSARFAVCETNDVEAFCTGSFDEEQMAWLESQLEQPERCILFFHHPPMTDDPLRLWAFVPSFHVEREDRFYEIAKTYQDRIDGIFVGHGHLWTKDMMNERIQVFETSATGDHNGDSDSLHLVQVSPSRGIIEVVPGKPDVRYL